jgi:hypothetical protein
MISWVWLLSLTIKEVFCSEIASISRDLKEVTFEMETDTMRAFSWYWCGYPHSCPGDDNDEDSPRKRLCFVHIYQKYNGMLDEHMQLTEKEWNYAEKERNYTHHMGQDQDNRDKYLWVSEERRQILGVVHQGLFKWLQNNMEKTVYRSAVHESDSS